jgi:PIN domain nuclease of toxin-antitoxin system
VFLAGDSSLTERARRVIENPEHDILASIASLWEVAIKHSLGKLQLSEPFEELFPHHLSLNSIVLIPIRLDHVSRVSSLPFHHRDPFDRLLIAQALVEEIPVLGGDEAFDA